MLLRFNFLKLINKKTTKERKIINFPKNIENDIRNIDNFLFFSKRINELKKIIEDNISPKPYSELYHRGIQNIPKIEK